MLIMGFQYNFKRGDSALIFVESGENKETWEFKLVKGESGRQGLDELRREREHMDPICTLSAWTSWVTAAVL